VKSKPVTQPAWLKLLICAIVSSATLFALNYLIQWLRNRSGQGDPSGGAILFHPELLFQWQCIYYLLPLLAGMALNWGRLGSIPLQSLFFASILTIPGLSFLVLYVISLFGYSAVPFIHPILAFLAGYSLPVFLQKER
jgi:hypothetical protein